MSSNQKQIPSGDENHSSEQVHTSSNLDNSNSNNNQDSSSKTSSNSRPKPSPSPAASSVKYTRVRKFIYQVQRRGFLSGFDKQKNEYFDHRGHYDKSESVNGSNLKNRPVIEEDTYPFGDEERNAWHWINDDWIQDGSDAWLYTSKHFSKKRFPVNSSRWSKSYGLTSSVRAKEHYRYALKKNVSDEEKKWLINNHYQIVRDGTHSSSKSKKSKKFTSEVSSHEDFQKQIKGITNELSEEYHEVQNKTLKPNILLLGGSGAGKSSLINAVFGKSLAEIGNGLPVTQTYKKFEDDEIDVVIYDSKGIEHGTIEEGFLEDTRKFFMELRKNNSMTNHIHVVWYVIDLTQARFQPFEAEFCRKHLKDIPIIFVFNKADAVSKNTTNIMLETVDKFKLKNAHGLFPTVAQCKNFDRKDCPACGSTRIRKRVTKGTCTILCKECKKKTQMHEKEGIEELSRATLKVLPRFVQSVFVNAQKSNMIFQEEEAKSVARKYFHKAIDIKLSKSLKEVLREMADELVTQVYKLPLLKEVCQKAVLECYSSYYYDTGLWRKLSIRLTDLLNGQSAPVLLIACAFEIGRNCIEFKEEVARLLLEDEEADEELISHQLLSKVHIEVDKRVIRLIQEEIYLAGSLDTYFERVKIDGDQSSYYPSKLVKQQGPVEEEEIVLHPYQKVPSKSDSEQNRMENNSNDDTDKESDKKASESNTKQSAPKKEASSEPKEAETSEKKPSPQSHKADTSTETEKNNSSEQTKKSSEKSHNKDTQ